MPTFKTSTFKKLSTIAVVAVPVIAFLLWRKKRLEKKSEPQKKEEMSAHKRCEIISCAGKVSETDQSVSDEVRDIYIYLN